MNGNSSEIPTTPLLPLPRHFPQRGQQEDRTDSPWCIPIGILRTAPDPSGAMRRLSFALSSCTPSRTATPAKPFRGGWIRHKNFPQGVWNVETGSVEKFTSKHLETLAVDKLLFLPFVLWIKSPRKSCAFGTFPHKLLLLPLLLPKPIDR